MNLRDMRTADVRNTRVLVSVDYNIAMTNGRVVDDRRIRATIPTIQWLLRRGTAVILVTHRGRPKNNERSLSLRPMTNVLSKLLRRTVRFFPGSVMTAAGRRNIQTLQPGEIGLLENIRFERGEEKNALSLARALAAIADVFVMDAFANAHRAHASTAGVAKYLPSYAGLLIQREVANLAPLLGRVRRPYVALLGGAKISTKLSLIRSLLKRADFVLLGGALANTILAAEGLAIGKSLNEPAMLKSVRGLSVAHRRLIIPVDVVTARTVSSRRAHICPIGKIYPADTIVDIGPDTVTLFQSIIAKARTIVWNGPMGMYEYPPYDRGTKLMATAIAKRRATAIAGGGETLDTIDRQRVAKKFTFLSTGGGAMLEFLEGKKLPGLEAVRQR